MSNCKNYFFKVNCNDKFLKDLQTFLDNCIEFTKDRNLEIKECELSYKSTIVSYGIEKTVEPIILDVSKFSKEEMDEFMVYIKNNPGEIKVINYKKEI